MDVVRKLFFAPFFLFSLVVMFIFADQMVAEPLGVLFGLTASSAFTLFYLVGSIILTGFFYILFVSMSSDWRLVVPVAILAGLVPFGLFADFQIGSYLAVGVLVSLLIGFFVQKQKMDSYVTFSAVQLLQPQIKLITLFLILSISIAYYSTATRQIKEEGFSIPDPLIEAAISMSGQQNQLTEMDTGSQEAVVPQLSPALVAQLKQNPEILKQYGYTPADLDALSAVGQKKSEGSTSGSLVSGLVKTQIDKIIAPYIDWVAPLLTLLFFISLSSLSSFFALVLPPLIGIIFMILEKIGFIHFDREMREVKKLTV